MDLNLCPGCQGFVSRDWETCHSCGHELNFDAPTPAEPQPIGEPISQGLPAEDLPFDASAPTAPTTTPAETTPETAAASSTTAFTLEPVPVVNEAVGIVPVQAVDQPETAHGFAAATIDAPTATVAFETAPFEIPEAEVEGKIPDELPVPQWINELPQQQQDASGVSLPFAPASPLSSKGAWVPNPNARTLNNSVAGVIAGIGLLSTVSALVFILVVSAFNISLTKTSSSTASQPKAAPAKKAPATTAAPAASPTWTHYTDPTGRFGVNLPVDQRSSYSIGGFTIVGGRADANTTVDVGYIDIPAGTPADQARPALEAEAKALTAVSNMKTVSTVTAMVNGHWEVDARTQQPTGPATGDLRMILFGGTAYYSRVITNDGNGNPTAFGALTGSFTVKS